jgi:hypothetical protein
MHLLGGNGVLRERMRETSGPLAGR